MRAPARARSASGRFSIRASANEAFPHLHWFSRAVGIDPDRLVAAYRLESAYHAAVLAETNPGERARLAREVYSRVHHLYGRRAAPAGAAERAAKGNLVRRLGGILAGRSILDVGCGTGAFLHAVHDALPHGRLLGIDGSAAALPASASGMQFREAELACFDVGERFDVAISDNVTEHIAPADLASHLTSIRRALRRDGVLVLLMPNRLFGPSDVTRIVDFSYTGRVPAQGTHLNESTWTEMLAVLEQAGFADFRPVTRIPLGFFLAMEQSPVLLRAARARLRRGQAILRRQIALTCRNVSSADRR